MIHIDKSDSPKHSLFSRIPQHFHIKILRCNDIELLLVYDTKLLVGSI